MESGSILKGEFLSLESARKIEVINSLSKDLNTTYDRMEKEIRILIKKYKELQQENAILKKEKRELELLIMEAIKK